ncbi:hypothetical protein J5N97_018247 [Dioscorea zingiberensis]|uniref:Uncharacterized protein n=1 Tax=Dioscorea zingiberensis TaxID=325984 RepID=A0A9D5CNN6_9LILI|nr:hypothetical protein J5N97_018247 [Dioscorea zingiberensis]
MASNVAKTRLIKAIVEKTKLSISRRSYSGRAAEEKKAGMVKKSKKESVGGLASPASSSSWVPDPVTGYYRPANRRPEVDAADLRKAMRSRKSS